MATCRSCSTPIQVFFSLGRLPLVNSFLRKREISKEKKYDLSVAFCPQCYLVQLETTVSPKDLFRHYIYFSSTSSTIVEHCRQTASYLTEKLRLSSSSLVLEIASNDGVLLQFFKKLGIQILGVDPAKNIAKVANEKGIRTIPDFFNYTFAKKLASTDGVQADMVYGANVLAHVSDIDDFLNGVKTVLKPEGTAVFEFPYLKGLLENKFDTIYHEHVFYYSLIALQHVVKKANLEIYDVEFISMQGGSLRIFLSHPGVFRVTDRVRQLASTELSEGFDNIKTYQNMTKRIIRLKSKLITLLESIKRRKKRIAAYSAPAKGLILLNYFGIDDRYLDFIVDKAKEKQGMYTPGVHMRVYPIEKIMKDQPDYVLILCWNIADEVMNSLAEYKRNGGTFILPIPEVTVR